MSLGILAIAFAGFLISYFNGANDVSKGIATLVGSGVTDYRRAILWGALCTALGGLTASLFARALVTTFSNGLLASGSTPTFAAALATILGAAAWVMLSTRTGLPVSTTHAIVGSLTGVAVLAYGFEGVRWGALGMKVVLPLILSPIASLVLTVTLVRLGGHFWGPSTETADCLCFAVEPATVALAGTGCAAHSVALNPARATLRAMSASAETCDAAMRAPFRLSLDHLHWLTSGATSFARGMNDAPKMAALILAAAALTHDGRLPALPIFALITFGMVAGSVVAGLRITRVLAEGVTRMNHREGFLANFVTSALVMAGAVGGLPMSTTHVSASAIIGITVRKGSRALNTASVRSIFLAWIVTVPAAAVLGILIYGFVRMVQG